MAMGLPAIHIKRIIGQMELVNPISKILVIILKLLLAKTHAKITLQTQILHALTLTLKKTLISEHQQIQSQDHKLNMSLS